MGNMQCPAEDAALLSAVARDICPFPDYEPSSVVPDMVTVNSSFHLQNLYTAVQSSLTSKQLEDFTQGLRTTFGREGKVTLGGVGVVALSLAVLFDTLARQVRGEQLSESQPIPGLFLKDPTGFYPQEIYTVSEYLRLVPHIANNPSRMKEETERYYKQLLIDRESLGGRKRNRNDDIYGVNILLTDIVRQSVSFHLLRIANSTVVSDINQSVRALQKRKGENPVSTGRTTKTGTDEANVPKTRKRRIPAPETRMTFNLNCEPEVASKYFLAEVPKSNDTEEAFRECTRSGYIVKTVLHYIARLAWLDVVNNMDFDFKQYERWLIAQREDFDLKANALKKWPE